MVRGASPNSMSSSSSGTQVRPLSPKVQMRMKIQILLASMLWLRWALRPSQRGSISGEAGSYSSMREIARRWQMQRLQQKAKGML